MLATHNPHKVVELREILADVVRDRGLDVDLDRAVVGAGDVAGLEEPVENGDSFAANALIKARAVSAATGLPALADDSGLAVDILGGAPGIFSARWSGKRAGGADRGAQDRANVELLLEQLARRAGRAPRAPGSSARRRWSRRTASSTSSTGRCAGCSAANRTGTTVSATTRSW